MKKQLTLLLLCLSVGLYAQVNYNANTVNDPYGGLFRPGVNPAFYPNWTSEQVADVAAGNSLFGQPGIGAKTMRTAMSDDFVTQFGYDYLLPTYDYYGDLGLTDLTVIVGFPHPSHQETTQYCSGIQSEMFEGLYEPIWDGGANGTPYNDDNLFAAYMYEITTRYTPYIKFWEIWNEPGFDYTGNCGWREPGDPVCNWWDNNPDPCDYKLRAPIQSYVRTLRIAYDIIKTVSPDDKLVVAGVGFESFLDAILRNTDNPIDGSVTADYPNKGGAYFDIMGFHSYPHFDGTTIYYDNNIGGTAYERHSDRAAFGIPFKQTVRQAVLDNYGYDGVTYPSKGWIITEINIPRDPVGGQWIGSEEAQKNYIIKAVVNAMKFDVAQIHVFRLGEREYFGTANNGQTGNPEFNLMGLYQRMDDILPYEQIINIEGMAYKTASDCLYGSTFDPAKTDEMNLPAGVDGGAFLQPSGEYTYVIWAKTTIDLSESASATYSFPSSFGFSDLYKKDWDYSQTLASGQISASNIALTATPIFLTVDEPTPPAFITLLCPDDVTVFADASGNGAIANWTAPNVSTTCASGLTINQVGGPTNGSYFPLGTTEIEYEATDDCGIVTLCNFNVTVQAIPGGCPDLINGYTLLGEYDSHKYFISNAVSRPADAQVAAQTVGGHLVVINSQGENDFIKSNISELVYIGLNDATTEGTMEWVNGDPVTYENYDPCSWCSPNSADDDYVVMHSWNGGWSFSNQFNQRLSVIELPCSTGPTLTEITLACPGGQDLVTSGSGATVAINWTAPTASTDCTTSSDVTLTQTTGPTNGSQVGAGTYTITYQATDACNSTPKTCSFTITVVDGMGTGCPGDIAGFTTIGEFGNSKYYLSNDVARHPDAQAVAVANGGYLASVSSQAENDFIQQGISEMVYIGLNDFVTEGNLEWTNGEPLTYNNIDPCGFCNENGPDQDFVIMAPWNGTWSFSNFYNSRLYVMEIDCSGTPPGPSITVNCPADITVQLQQGETTGIANFDPVQATTTCPQGGLTITKLIGPNPGASRPPGIYTTNYSITDACGNMEECSVMITILPPNTGGGCPPSLPGFTKLGEFGSSAYFVSNDVARAEDGEAAAQAVGGHLATIDSQAENDFLFPLVEGVVYIGLNDAAVEGTLEWYDGTAVGYTNFDICGFCSENNDDNDYVVMHSWNGGWSWSNFWNSRNYIIEVPCTVPVPFPFTNGNTTLLAMPNNTITKKASVEKVMPNPASDHVFVKINSEREEIVDVQIFDARGSLMKTEKVTLYKGMNFKEFAITDLPSGLYYVMIPQGQNKSRSVKFIKQRL